MLTWEEKCTALEDAFRSLPIKRFKKTNAIPYEIMIPGMGRQLMLMTPAAPPQILPTAVLRNLKQSSARIIKVLDSHPSIAFSAMNYKSVELKALIIKLKLLSDVTASAMVERRRGRPTIIQPAEIAEVVAQHYFGLTGRKPAVSKNLLGVAFGPFLELMQKVFEILGVEASALSQAEKISRNWSP